METGAIEPLVRIHTHRPAFIVLVLMAGVVGSCMKDEGSSVMGAQLARTHCGSCHLFPEPSLLDDEQWRQVLPAMGHRLGVYDDADRDSLVANVDLRGVDTTRVFPDQPLITDSEWEAIEAYYLSAAPDEMEPVRRQQVLTPGLPEFEIRVPERRFERPLTLLTTILPEYRRFFLAQYGYREPSTLAMIDPAGQVLHQWRSPDAPVRVHWDAGRLYVLFAGPGPEPTEASAGSLVVLDAPNTAAQAILTGLKRPVDVEFADLNDDGITDVLVCEYGHEAGFLSLYEGDASGGYRRRVLTEEPGAVQAVIHDFDRNGTPDIGVLMAQGNEGFDIYANDGDGGFTRHRKLRFPPVFGSNDVQIADFNGDGRMDLLYVNGDNADFTPVVKRYHGLRLYLAEEGGDFREALFFPLPGASSARVGDFDGDGDLDIAAIAYFADYVDAPEEGFVYLENQGELTFEGRTMADARLGRWLTMDSGDLDGDGDLDILLGSNIGFSPQGDTTGLFQHWSTEGPPYVLLENMLR